MTSAAAMTPSGDASRCDYGKVVEAPRGFIPRDDLVTVRKDPLTAWVGNHPVQASAATQDGVVTIPVAFHVLRKDRTLSGGNIPQSQIAAQISVLNKGYAGTGFRFELVETTRTTKASWFKLFYTQGGEPRFFRGSHKEIQIKQALHSGDAETLNVYSGALGKRLLGWAYYPDNFTTSADGSPLPRFFDGVVIDYRSLPGGGFTVYNEGDTLTHEAGHWLGLYHTFSNGCTAPGDRVADTPYEASPAFGCPVGRDTCVDKPGLDPIHNFMDYTYDECMYEFTPGQAVRMHQAWDAYRQIG
jgi:hypothetical protein